MTQNPRQDLEEIRANVERSARLGDEEGIVTGLLAVWTQHRSSDLAEAIDSHFLRLTHALVPVADSQQWQNLAQRADPKTVGRLLVTPWQQMHPRGLRKRLGALLRFPDPRMVGFAREVSAYAQQHHGRLATQVVTEAARVQQFHADLQAPSTDPDILAILAAAASAREDMEDELLGAVHAAPGDDQPRLVYADYLMERGDPLGRYIVASLNHRAAPVELTAEQKRTWCRHQLGPVDPDRVELRRGFPYKLRLLGQAPQSPLRWGTIEEIDWENPGAASLPQLSGLARARSLKAFRILSWIEQETPWMTEALSVLAGLGLRELTLPLAAWRGSRFEPDRWPRLERLGFWLNHPSVRLDQEFLGSATLRPIEIGLVSWSLQVGVLVEVGLEASRSCAPGITKLWMRSSPAEFDGLELQLERDSSGAFRGLRLTGLLKRNVGVVWRMITRLSPADLDKITVETSLWEDKAFIKRIHSALKRLHPLPIEVIPPIVRP